MVSTAFARIEERIQQACERSGRDRAAVLLVGASKRQSINRLEAAYSDGLRVFGENRVQEAEDKIPRLASDIDWHLIGPLQSNKAARAASIFSTIHSIDRLKIARALNRHAQQLDRNIDGFLQVNLGGEASKSGFDAQQLLDPALLDALFALDHLSLRGLMAIPPPADTPDQARHWFRQLRQLSERLRALCPLGTALSMGMSSDFELAIEEGATHIRLGSILFGPRETG